QILRKGGPGLGLLRDRLSVGEEDADRLGRTPGGEKPIAVVPAVLFRGIQPDGIEALLDGAGALIRGQNPLALRDHGLCDAGELITVHSFFPPANGEAPAGTSPVPPASAPGRSREW